MKLKEIDLLRLKNFDNEIEKLILMIEISRSKANEANNAINRLKSSRADVYENLKTEYKIGDFNYDRETGEIIENRPASPSPPQSKS